MFKLNSKVAEATGFLLFSKITAYFTDIENNRYVGGFCQSSADGRRPVGGFRCKKILIFLNRNDCFAKIADLFTGLTSNTLTGV